MSTVSFFKDSRAEVLLSFQEVIMSKTKETPGGSWSCIISFPLSTDGRCYLLLVIKYGKVMGSHFLGHVTSGRTGSQQTRMRDSLAGPEAAAWLWESGRGPCGRDYVGIYPARELARKGDLHPATTRIWILAATIWAWRRTQLQKGPQPWDTCLLPGETLGRGLS